MNRQLLVVSIGPVQSFIAAARKTEDLWSGSHLLSHLARKAIEFLFQKGEEQHRQVEMVYPAVTEDELKKSAPVTERDAASLPNRFVALITGEAGEVAELARETKEAVRKELIDLCRGAINHVFSIKPEDKPLYQQMYQQAERQVDSSLEFFWALEKLPDDRSFEEARSKVERRLAAVKNNRTHPPHGQNGLICTICGERDALCNEKLDDNDPIGKLRQKLEKTWKKRKGSFLKYEGEQEGEGRIQDGEYLCALCLCKRASRELFGKKPFPSVLEIAQDEKYYAILMMDGDDMGKWVSGEKRPDRNDEEDAPGHAMTQLDTYREISRRLSRFAKQTVPQIVQEYEGELVYAGGDDVLAFAPVKNVLSLARELRKAFSDPKRGLDRKATASMGIIIAYCKDPLYRMLNRVRSLEKKAKSFRREDGTSKDAFALAYLARSGEQREVVLPWLVDPQNPGEWTVSHLNYLIDSIKSEVSSTFLFTFSQSFLPLLPREANQEEGKLAVFGKDDPRNEELLEVELKRLLRRALKESDQSAKAESLAKSLVILHRLVPASFQFIQLMEILRILGVKKHEGASAKAG